ncbi:MAG: dihydroneopterin aldolase [Candidatus Aegiribacteria sp.]|nr:dihydroneopterin aldolase [Candidatus Aegiribacteria sp.]
MKGRLVLKNTILRLKLGVAEHEKISSRDVPVTVSWSGEITSGPTVDYSDVCKTLAGFEGRDYDYIENLASDILIILRREYPAGRWLVTVTKPFPPVSLKMESASFTVEGVENG